MGCFSHSRKSRKDNNNYNHINNQNPNGHFDGPRPVNAASLPTATVSHRPATVTSQPAYSSYYQKPMTASHANTQQPTASYANPQQQQQSAYYSRQQQQYGHGDNYYYDNTEQDYNDPDPDTARRAGTNPALKAATKMVTEMAGRVVGGRLPADDKHASYAEKGFLMAENELRRRQMGAGRGGGMRVGTQGGRYY